MGPLNPSDYGQRAVSDDLAELRCAVALAGVRGLSPAHARLMIDRAGSARAAVSAVRRGERFELAEEADGPIRPIGRVLSRRLREIRLPPNRRLRELAERGIRLLSYRGPGYPRRLEDLFDPPTVLYLAGPGPLPDPHAVAIVGTRSATRYGREVARSLGAGLASAGCTVVSGMARGIDGQSHRGALDVGGATVGVLGSGLDHEYPRDNSDLYHRMRRSALLVSEFVPELRPGRGLFPRRNRIIAALARAVVVVQAGQKSGANNTVEHATQLGRDVLAVPGPIGPAVSAGVHALLKDGAAVVTSPDDVLRALAWPAWPATRPPAASPGDALVAPTAHRDATLLEALSDEPVAADELAERTGLEVGRVLSRMAHLELEGLVRGLPGGRFERIEPRPAVDVSAR